MLQSTTACIATGVFILGVIRNARLLVDFCRAIIGVVINTDDLYGIFTLYLADGLKELSISERGKMNCGNYERVIPNVIDYKKVDKFLFDKKKESQDILQMFLA